MTQTKVPHVANVTIQVIDNVMAIFLAVLWFSAFDDVLHQILPPDHHWWAVLTEVGLVLLIITALAWELRSSSFALAAFCGAGAHFCSFMGMHMAENMQKNHFTLSPLWCAFGFFVVAFIFAVLCLTLYHVKSSFFNVKVGSESNPEEVNEFMDRFDDVENDFVAMSLASYWVLVVRFMITNDYPEDSDVEPGQKPPHDGDHRTKILLYALGSLVVGTLLVGCIPSTKNRGYGPGRAIDIFKAFIISSWVFAFIIWAKMTFYEHPTWSLAPILTRIVFASCVTAVSLLAIVLMAAGSHGSEIRMVLLKSVALMVGISWEETFDASLEVLFDGYENVHWLKGAVAIALSVMILPGYVKFFKPYSIKAEEEEGG